MIAPRYIVAFVGHRTGYDESLIRPSIKAGLEGLSAQAHEIGGQIELYSGVAEGSDVLCVEVAQELKIPVHLLLPLLEEEFKNDFTSETAWQRSSSSMEHVKKRPRSGSIRPLSSGSRRPDCYYDQAIQMLDVCDVLLCLWNGQPSRGLGGTAEVIEYAAKLEKPVIVINSNSGEIVYSQGRSPSFKRDTIIVEVNELLRSQSGQNTNALTCPNEIQSLLDNIAIKSAIRQPSQVAVILLQGLATVLAVITTYHLSKHSAWENSKWLITGAEFVIISFCLFLSARYKASRIRQTWAQSRFACELFRSLSTSIPLVDPLHPLIQRHAPEWRRFSISVGLLIHEAYHIHDIAQMRDHYVIARLGGRDGNGQIGYHNQRIQENGSAAWGLFSYFAGLAGKLTLLFVAVSLLNKVYHLGFEESLIGWICVVMAPISLGVFELVAGRIESIIHNKKNESVDHLSMAHFLDSIKYRLQFLQTQNSISKAVATAEEAILLELAAWMRKTGESRLH